METEVLRNLGIGFSVALQPINLFFCFVGVFIGTLIGVLPGIGPAGAIALLIPTTFGSSPEAAIIMLAGVYYGAMYGGSTTSILVKIPGEAASVMTCIDGYQMALQGRAGPALGISAFGSFIGGTISILGLMLMAPPLAEFALKLGPPEYFSLMILGLILLIYLCSASVPKALLMGAFGIILGLVGLDPINVRPRLTFGLMELLDGVGLVPVIMGLFGVAEVLVNIEQTVKSDLIQTKIKNLLPSIKDWAESAGAIIRGSILGFFLGILPGGGAIIASFVSYAMEKRIAKHPENFGNGAIAGVAGPETANNAATGGAFIPLMTLGIPPNAIMAMLLGALMIHGIQPGPMMIKENPGIFWGLVASMYVGNVMLIVLNLPLIGLWIQILKVPYKILFPFILLFCVIGAYGTNYTTFDIYVLLIFGAVGYLMRKFQYEAAPLVLALVLGPILEENLRKSLIMFRGDFTVFLTRPISAFFMLTAIILLLSALIPAVNKRRLKMTTES